MSVVDDNKHQQTNQQPATEESTAALSSFNKLNINKPGTAANAKKHAHKPKAKDDRPRPWRLRPLALIRYHAPPRVYRPLVKAARTFNQFWGVNSGDWQWMANNPLPLKSLNRSLWRGAEPSFNYYMMLFLSGVISTLGLLAGSTAAIIGAMIVAPLMGPIIGMAFAITMGNRRLLKRSVLSVVTGTLLTVGTAYLICSIIGLNSLNSEILQRTRPTLIDLAIGLAAGAAGAFATTRREVAEALPGVAIAVALVPPLSVIGIGLAHGDLSIFTGSTLLFLTNLAGIVLSGGLVFIWQDYGSIRRAKRGLTASTIVIAVLGIPLGVAMRDLIVEERARSVVGNLIRRETETFGGTDIRRLRVDSTEDGLSVYLEVAARVDSISDNQVELVHAFLEREMKRPIELDVSIFPAREIGIEAGTEYTTRRAAWRKRVGRVFGR